MNSKSPWILINYYTQQFVMNIGQLTFLFFFSPFLLLAQEKRDTMTIEEALIANGMSKNMVIEEEVVKEFAPDFEMTMEDGSKKKLSDFKGEVIYLSFWASWCKPCINGFNKYREVREQMDSLGVIMLNVSIDKDADKWKAAIKEHDPTGIHATVDRESVRDSYQMYNVPLYEIVGRKGQFLYLSDAPGRDILDNFRQFIDEQ